MMSVVVIYSTLQRRKSRVHSMTWRTKSRNDIFCATAVHKPCIGSPLYFPFAFHCEWTNTSKASPLTLWFSQYKGLYSCPISLSICDQQLNRGVCVYVCKYTSNVDKTMKFYTSGFLCYSFIHLKVVVAYNHFHQCSHNTQRIFTV